MFDIKGKYTSARIFIDDVEPELLQQLNRVVNNPAFDKPIFIMPDTHVGKGCVIGFATLLGSKVVPNVIGVDIGCGVYAVKIQGIEFFSLSEIDTSIRQIVPFGNKVHNEILINMKQDFPWEALNHAVEELSFELNHFRKDIVPFEVIPPNYDFSYFQDLCKRINIDESYAVKSVGTLGGGNHFIEIGKDSKQNNWLTIHSGSRNLGLKVCHYWQPKNSELGYLEGKELIGYFFDMLFAQEYARFNRYKMMSNIINIMDLYPSQWIESVHNCIDFMDLVIRKGAIRSDLGQDILIPLNMRDGTLLCKGKGNLEWLSTAPHGAGRIMSRGQAKKTLTVEEFEKDMNGIYSTSVGNSTLDESPRVYKDSKMIEELIKPTVEVIDKIIPILNMKA